MDPSSSGFVLCCNNKKSSLNLDNQDLWEGVTPLKIRLFLSFQIDHTAVVNTSMNMGLDQVCLAAAIHPNLSPSVAQVDPTEVQHV